MLKGQELDQLERKRQSDSDWILEKIDLIPKLEKYGEVKIAGAKALGLMFAKDIDISVLVDEVNTKDWQELVSVLMVTPDVRKVTAIDYFNYDNQNKYNPSAGQKYSLYISMDKLMGPEQDKFDNWECQIHLIERKIFDETKITGVKAKLTPEKRILILKFKAWADKVNKVLKELTDGNYKIYSPSIYEAVLDKNIMETDTFLYFLSPVIPDKFRQHFSSSVEKVGMLF